MTSSRLSSTLLAAMLLFWTMVGCTDSDRPELPGALRLRFHYQPTEWTRFDTLRTAHYTIILTQENDESTDALITCMSVNDTVEFHFAQKTHTVREIFQIDSTHDSFGTTSRSYGGSYLDRWSGMFQPVDGKMTCVGYWRAQSASMNSSDPYIASQEDVTAFNDSTFRVHKSVFFSGIDTIETDDHVEYDTLHISTDRTQRPYICSDRVYLDTIAVIDPAYPEYLIFNWNLSLFRWIPRLPHYFLIINDSVCRFSSDSITGYEGTIEFDGVWYGVRPHQRFLKYPVYTAEYGVNRY